MLIVPITSKKNRIIKLDTDNMNQLKNSLKDVIIAFKIKRPLKGL